MEKGRCCRSFWGWGSNASDDLRREPHGIHRMSVPLPVWGAEGQGSLSGFPTTPDLWFSVWMFCFHVFQDRLSKKRDHSGGKKVLLVKVKELDGKAKTLHVQSPRIPPPSWLPVTRCPFRPEVPFHSAITPLADRRASANINVISQRAERTQAAPSRARRHIAHVLPSRLCHGANRARRGEACGSRVLFFYPRWPKKKNVCVLTEEVRSEGRIETELSG